MSDLIETLCPLDSKCPGRFSLKILKAHIDFCHSNSAESSQQYLCRETGCCRNFSDWEKFRRHVSSNHKFNAGLVLSDNVVHATESEATVTTSNNFTVDSSMSEESDPVYSIETVKCNMRRVFSCFVGKMYSNPKMPRSFVQDVVLGVICLMDQSICQVKSMSSRDGSNSNDSVQCFEEILSVLNEFSTEYRRIQIMRETGNYIEATSVVIGSEVRNKSKGGQIVKEISPLSGQFIPIKRVLECFFSMPGVFDEVMGYVKLLETETFGITGNFVHGALWKFKVDRMFFEKLVLPLFFYHDEYEINNPLGSHAGIAKQGGTYFSIPCLPPEHRSQLTNIFLAMLTYASDRKSEFCTVYRNEAIFRNLVSQINDLQKSGIVIKCDGQEHRLYFGFGLLLGDNEGLNNCQDIASASSHCRFCKASPSDIKVDLYEKPELLRCVGDYESDISDGFKVSGIKGKSVWNDIDGHHVYNNYAVDLLHDLEEGILKYGMSHVVFHFVNNATKKVSLGMLNDRLKTFNYYDNGISNRPQLISDGDLNTAKRLKMSGSEMHNFTLIFSLLVGDLISTKDKVWKYYLLLRKILDVVYAPEIQVQYIDSFSQLVASHHKMYIKLFKDTLKPKHHNLLHYARVMKQSGPLSHLSTFRYEARHKPNKEAAAATSSRRDPLKTVAIKNQLQLCYRFTANQGLRERFEIGPFHEICIEEQQDLQVPDRYGVFGQVSWVQFKGTKYRPNMCVCHNVNESHGLPEFGQIDKILCNENFEILLYCKDFKTLGLEENYFAYEVQETVGHKNVPLNSLPIFSPVIFRKMACSDQLLMTLRHAL